MYKFVSLHLHWSMVDGLTFALKYCYYYYLQMNSLSFALLVAGVCLAVVQGKPANLVAAPIAYTAPVAPVATVSHLSPFTTAYTAAYSTAPHVVGSAAYVAPYASTYNAHTVAHAAAYPAAYTFAAPAHYTAAHAPILL